MSEFEHLGIANSSFRHGTQCDVTPHECCLIHNGGHFFFAQIREISMADLFCFLCPGAAILKPVFQSQGLHRNFTATRCRAFGSCFAASRGLRISKELQAEPSSSSRTPT